MCATGFGLASLAASALGVDRTYFGWELGVCDGEYVQRFPYGVIPHPMIVGGALGWLGFHALPAFRQAFPSYAPLHGASITRPSNPIATSASSPSCMRNAHMCIVFICTWWLALLHMLRPPLHGSFTRSP